MKQGPLVSVIISAYNVDKYISGALYSILKQDYENLEVLVADDCSQDRTRSIIDRIQDHRIVRVHNEENIGYLRTWNKLLPLAKGKYITFQDGDDVSHPKRVAKLVSFLEAHPHVGVCGSNFVRFFQPWGLYAKSNFPTNQEEIDKAIANKTVPFAGTRIMVRREAYEKVGGFREFFHGLTWEDYDWILRMMEHYPAANIPDVLYEYRYFRRSASKQSSQPSLEKMVVDKIGFFLAEQRRTEGLDALQKNEPERIKEFLSSLGVLFHDSVHLNRHSRLLKNLVANKDFQTAWGIWLTMIRQYPAHAIHLRGLYLITSALVRTAIKSIVFRLSGKSRYSILEF
jgi:glycosyltransferase involved in cell wall biosynthesis